MMSKVQPNSIVGTEGPYLELRDILKPKHYSTTTQVYKMRGRYKGHLLEFRADRSGFHEVVFLGKPDPHIRKELRKLAGLKT